MPVASIHRSSPHATISPSPSLSRCRCRRRGQRSRALLADGDGFDTRSTMAVRRPSRQRSFPELSQRPLPELAAVYLLGGSEPTRYCNPANRFPGSYIEFRPVGGGGCRGTEPLRGCGAQPIEDLACTEASHHCSGRGRMRWMLWN